MRKFLLILLISSVLFGMSGCATYRLQYEEGFLPIEDEQTATGDRDPYIYLYEESYSKPAWFIWGCGLTFWYYGGICWFHHMSHRKDVEDIQEKGHKKLLTLFGTKKKIETTHTQVTNFKSENRHLPPRLRVFDPAGNTIVRGEANKIQNVPPEIWLSQGKVDQKLAKESREKPYLNLEEPNPYDSEFTYRSLRIGFHEGNASVRSHITEAGNRSTIAAGSMPYQMLEIRTHDLAKNGWFWSWAPNLSSQRLKIEDFTSGLPLYQSSEAYDIPVVISNPNDQSLIANYVNTYQISLQTTGLMVGGGFSKHWKLKGENNFWSLSAMGWLSVVDYMQAKVEFNSREVRKSNFAAFQSYQLDFDAYYNIRAWNLAIGFHSIGRVFPAVQMPDDMEFRGPARYDANKKVFERPRMFIDELEFTSRTFGISVSYILEEYNFND